MDKNKKSNPEKEKSKRDRGTLLYFSIFLLPYMFIKSKISYIHNEVTSHATNPNLYTYFHELRFKI